MSLDDFLIVFTRYVFILLAILTVVDFIRHRDGVRLDILLMFGGLSINFIISILKSIFPQLALSDAPGWMGLLAHPYLFLRLTQHFRVVRKSLMVTALVGMCLSWLFVFLISTPTAPLYMVIIAVGYFVGIEGVAVTAFITEARRTAGVTRYRLNLVATGSALLAFVIVLVGASALSPDWILVVRSLGSFIVILAGISYYFGFAPPRWLSRAWQLGELQTFLREPAPRSGAEALGQLCHSSIRAVGGKASLAFLPDQKKEWFEPVASEGFKNPPRPVAINEGVAGLAWTGGRALVTFGADRLGGEEKRLADSVPAQTLMVIPITGRQRTWGILLVFLLRSPLFPNEDLSLLGLFAEQSALTLENLQLLEEVHRHAAELEQRVNERTAELRDVNEELKQFASIVSHDLRAPLVNIRGFAEELRLVLNHLKTNLEDACPGLDSARQQRLANAFDIEIPEALGYINSSVSRMNEFLNALLKLARLGRRELQFESVDVQTLVNETLKTLGHQIETNQVEVSVGRLPEINADPLALEQIFGNILTNAVNYLDASRPGRIAISAQRDPTTTTFSIRDNGRGIAREDYPKIFAPLRRAGKQDVPGEGMGLAYVQTLVRLHGGKIWFESEPGVGTTFFVTLANDPTGANNDSE